MLHQRINDNGWGFYIDIEDNTILENKKLPIIEIPDNDSYIEFYDEYMYDDYRCEDYTYYDMNCNDTKKLTNTIIKVTSNTILAIMSVSCFVYFIL